MPELEAKLEGLKKELLLRIAEEIHFEADKNLKNPVPWGTFPIYEEFEKGPRGRARKDTVIWNTGNLAGSGEVKMVGDKAVVKFKSDYAGDVEFGSEPKEVEWSEIHRWVRRKLGLKGKDANRATFFIQRKIKRLGISPHSFLRRATHEVIQRYKKAGTVV